MSDVTVESVSRTMLDLLVRHGRPVIYHDPATGEDLAVSPEGAAAPDGLLPAFVVAGEAVWRELTGKGFALDITRDPQALLGYRLRAIGAGTFTTVMLATMEATAQVAEPGAIIVNDLKSVWSAAAERIEHGARSSLRSVPSAAPGVAP